MFQDLSWEQLLIQPTIEKYLKLVKIISNILQAIFTCCGLVIIVFVLGKLVPIDPALTTVGDTGSTASYQQVRSELGIDLPLITQIRQYFIKLISGDWGRSTLTTNQVTDDIKKFFPATIELATFAILLGGTGGILLGVLSAYYQNTIIDNILRVISLVGNSMSIFWLGTIGLVIFYAKLKIAPAPGRLSIVHSDFIYSSGFILFDSLCAKNWPVFIDALWHIILPGGLLAFCNLAHISRMTRLFVVEQLKLEYVTTAKVIGMQPKQILFRDILPNILVPIITLIILSYASLLEGATFIEMIYMWPGIGFYLTQALMNNDINATLGCTLVIGVIFVSFNLMTDYLYKLLDPRTIAT